MAESLHDLTDEKLRSNAEALLNELIKRGEHLQETGAFISGATGDIADPEIKMHVFLHQRDTVTELDVVHSVIDRLTQKD